MSPTARRTTKHAFKSFALISETFLFTYLGISAVVSVRSVLHLEWSFMLIIATLVSDTTKSVQRQQLQNGGHCTRRSQFV